MATEVGVRVHCGNTCGAVIVPPASVTIFICPDDPDRNCYSFFCPGKENGPPCGHLTSKHATDATIALLHSLGCPIKSLTIPAEWRDNQEAGRFDAQAPVGEDDLIDFMAGIERFNRTGAWSK